jgi:hypothetical protein
MTLFRRPIARNIKQKSSLDERKYGDHYSDHDCSKSMERSEGTSNTEKLATPAGRNCNPTPVDNEKESDDDDEINAGPDPFPYRPPRQARINQLMKFYNDFIDSDAAKNGEEFRLEDFILDSNSMSVPHQLDYMMSYQTKDHQMGDNKSKQITDTLRQTALNTVDLNKLVNIELVPRHIPTFLKRLNQIHEQNCRDQDILAEKIKLQYEMENKISRLSTQNSIGNNYPTTPLTKNDGLEIPNNFCRDALVQNLSPNDRKPLPPLTPKPTKLPGRKSKVRIADTDREQSRLENASERYSATPIQPDTPDNAIKQTNYPITAIELAIFDSLAESGGLTLSLRGWFLPSLPILQPLDSTLVYLNLSYNSFQVVPPFVFTCSNLQVLKLRNNPIEKIPNGIITLSRLRILIISYCKLREVPDVLFKLPVLIFVDLSYNYLTDILPESIGHCDTLRYLNLAGNELTGMPHTSIKMNFHKIKLKNNLMSKAFWKDMDTHSPPSLAILALRSIDQNLENFKLHNSIKAKLKSAKRICSICRNISIGQFYNVLRPCPGMIH